ncbi:hypothetical protein T492DRAFT_832604 [Pavlovales sp. CCMP2436]|nr:hypothetical protein T492DRAFT_832604 [Pavlovales sp. CCMP2436]
MLARRLETAFKNHDDFGGTLRLNPSNASGAQQEGVRRDRRMEALVSCLRESLEDAAPTLRRERASWGGAKLRAALVESIGELDSAPVLCVCVATGRVWVATRCAGIRWQLQSPHVAAGPAARELLQLLRHSHLRALHPADGAGAWVDDAYTAFVDIWSWIASSERVSSALSELMPSNDDGELAEREGARDDDDDDVDDAADGDSRREWRALWSELSRGRGAARLRGALAALDSADRCARLAVESSFALAAMLDALDDGLSVTVYATVYVTVCVHGSSLMLAPLRRSEEKGEGVADILTHCDCLCDRGPGLMLAPLRRSEEEGGGVADIVTAAALARDGVAFAADGASLAQDGITADGASLAQVTNLLSYSDLFSPTTIPR